MVVCQKSVLMVLVMAMFYTCGCQSPAQRTVTEQSSDHTQVKSDVVRTQDALPAKNVEQSPTPDTESVRVVSAPTQLPTPPPDRESLHGLLQAMLVRMQSRVTSGYRVALGNFVFEDTGIPSNFARYLAREFSVAISDSGFWKEFSRTQLDVLLAEAKLSMLALFDADSRPNLGNFKVVQGIFTGSYWLEKDGIKVYVDLLDVEQGGKIASGECSVKMAILPENVQVKSENFQQALHTLQNFTTGKNPDFKIKVWVDKNAGGVYRVGEKLRLHFQAEAACYLKLYHVAANGEVQLIFPNRFQKAHKIEPDKVYTIPAESDDFEFAMKKPLGSEIIKAMASTVPFADVEEMGTVLGKVETGGQELEQIKTRGLEVKEKAKTAETSCVYTIIE